MTKTEQTRGKLSVAIHAIDRELEELTGGSASGYTSREQLLHFKRVLERMLDEVNTGQLPLPSRRSTGMAHVIVDSWPVHSPLGELIVEAEQAYVNL